MKTKLAALIGLIINFSIASAQPVNVNVTSVPLWTDTGIALTNGEWVNVNSSGWWQYGPGANDPDGILYYFNVWLNNNIQTSLIGFVGADPYQGSQWESGIFQTNQYLELGTARQFVSNTNGELWLGFNDDAFTGPTSDNGGSVLATVSLGFETNGYHNNLTLGVAQVSSNSFAFFITNGLPSTVCAIYDSADLIHWTLLDSILLDGSGSLQYATDLNPPSPTSGLIGGSFVNNNGVPYRFFKVSNGQFWSPTIGFLQIPIGPYSTNMIPNQFDDPNGNNLDGLFNIGSSHTMIDGTSLPSGTQILKWNMMGFNVYTWGGTSWSPSGSPTLNPGELAMIINPTANAFTLTFAGIVREGHLTVPISGPGDYSAVSSIVPQAGGIQSVLGFNPGLGDEFLQWRNGNYVFAFYDPISLDQWGSPTSWYDGGYNPVQEPVINVGESFFILPANSGETWTRDFSARP